MEAAFDDFVEACCVRGPDQHASFVKLESAFVTFLQVRYGVSNDDAFSRARGLDETLHARGYHRSAGRSVDGRIKLWYVLGLSVARFVPKEKM